MLWTPKDYQKAGVRFLIERKRCGLFLDPGLGKTSISLAAFRALRLIDPKARALVVAPLRVAGGVWSDEARKWDQFRGIRISRAIGGAGRRLKALEADADLYTITPGSIRWLEGVAKQKKLELPRILIVDESSRFKNPSALCWKSLKRLLPSFDRVAILNGTPCSNSLEDLWSQIFAIDGGDRLGRSMSAFRLRYFYRAGYQGREWFPLPDAKEKIEAAISDLVLRLDGRDWLDLPELLTNDVFVDLPADVLKGYKKLERELLFELEGVSKLALSAGSKYGLCRQVASGGIYTGEKEDRAAALVHSAKIDALESLVEELAGKPVLVCYWFRHELERLKAWRKAPALNGDAGAAESRSLVERWNRKEIPVLYCQPRSMSHGLNMQEGGSDLVWFTLPDDPDAYQQTIARLLRQGQKAGTVRNHRILAKSTVDLAVRRALETKSAAQEAFLNALREYSKGAFYDVGGLS